MLSDCAVSNRPRRCMCWESAKLQHWTIFFASTSFAVASTAEIEFFNSFPCRREARAKCLAPVQSASSLDVTASDSQATRTWFKGENSSNHKILNDTAQKRFFCRKCDMSEGGKVGGRMGKLLGSDEGMRVGSQEEIWWNFDWWAMRIWSRLWVVWKTRSVAQLSSPRLCGLFQLKLKLRHSPADFAWIPLMRLVQVSAQQHRVASWSRGA